MLYYLICVDTIPLNIPKDTNPIIPVPEEKYVPSESKEVIANVSKEDNDKPREKKSDTSKKIVPDRKEEKIRKLMKKYYKKKIQRLDEKDLEDLVKSFNKIEKTSKSRKKASSERKVLIVEPEENEVKDMDVAHDDVDEDDDAHASKKQNSSSPKRLVKMIDHDDLDDREMKIQASTSKNKTDFEPNSNFRHEDLGHTCQSDMSKICPKCYRFRFTTTRAFVNYNPNHTYTLSLNLDISSEPLQVLRENRAKLKLFPTRLAGNDFRILNNFVNIDNDKKVNVTVFSPHSRK